MSKRLKVILQRQPSESGEKKIQAIRAAVRHAFPTADIQVMLNQIESDYPTPGVKPKERNS
jgi:hypothetical protein